MDPEAIDPLIERAGEAYTRRDPELWIADWDPECEWHPYFSAEVEGAAAYRGHEGIRQWFRDVDEIFSRVSWEAEEVRDLGDERFLVLGRLRAEGRGSGVTVDSPIGQLLELRDGKVLRGWAYLSHDEAERAAARKG